MSLPLGIITPSPVSGAFMSPLDEPYNPLEEAVLGGTAIGSGALGREVQRWTVAYIGTTIGVYDSNGMLGYSLAVPGVTSVSLAFDTNMQVAIGYTTSAGGFLYYFNSLTLLFDTIHIPTADSVRVCVDDPRLFDNTNSDVLFAYTLDGVLYYRQQRDRYVTAYTVGPTNGLQLLRMGQNVLFRVQFKLGKYVAP